jgi:hypothetical protein
MAFSFTSHATGEPDMQIRWLDLPAQQQGLPMLLFPFVHHAHLSPLNTPMTDPAHSSIQGLYHHPHRHVFVYHQRQTVSNGSPGEHPALKLLIRELRSLTT